MKKAYKFRIYPTKAQEEQIQKTFNCCRFIYNYYLSKRKEVYETAGETFSYFDCANDMTKLKQDKQWLREADSQALVYTIRYLDVAYKNFFHRVKKGETPGYPKYKSKYNAHNSYTTMQKSIRLSDKHINLPKLGLVKCVISNNVEGRIVSVTVCQNPSGKYFVSILTEIEASIPQNTLNKDNAIGLDYSSPHFYVDSNGNAANMPHYYHDAELRLKREQRKLSKMTFGSNNYQKQKTKVARIYERVQNSRNDWQNKESRKLAERYDIVCVEDINYQSLSQTLNIAKATYDNAFGTFRKMLSYKLEQRGKKLIVIDKWFPSSKMCRHCGYINHKLELKDRQWVCPQCNQVILRDENAAINIKLEGLTMLA